MRTVGMMCDVVCTACASICHLVKMPELAGSASLQKPKRCVVHIHAMRLAGIHCVPYNSLLVLGAEMAH